MSAEVPKPDISVIRSKIPAYYFELDQGRLDQLGNYLANPMSRWFNSRDVPLEKVIADSRKYLEKYPFREVNINWETLQFSELEDNLLQVSYTMDYKIKKGKFRFFKKYRLLVTTVWNNQNKVVSMYERQLN